MRGEEVEVVGDTVLWIEKGEKHQMINTGDETLKLATVFVPAYTAAQNYARCEAAARKANAAEDRGEA